MSRHRARIEALERRFTSTGGRVELVMPDGRQEIIFVKNTVKTVMRLLRGDRAEACGLTQRELDLLRDATLIHEESGHLLDLVRACIHSPTEDSQLDRSE
jgi:hypothetical protein